MEPTADNVAMQFANAHQQRDAVTLGMWIFLATEVLFFGGMFVAYTVYRSQYPEVFVAAGSHTNLWIGGVMTAFLLVGSLLVAMSDHALEHAETDGISSATLRSVICRRLFLTAALGVVFLSCELYEYHSLIEDRLFPGSHFDNVRFEELAISGRSAQIFYTLYFCMTGLHGLHMLIGIVLVSGIAVAMRYYADPTRLRNTLKVIGLYWHFVDIIWLFLYPLFYLVG